MTMIKGLTGVQARFRGVGDHHCDSIRFRFADKKAARSFFQKTKAVVDEVGNVNFYRSKTKSGVYCVTANGVFAVSPIYEMHSHFAASLLKKMCRAYSININKVLSGVALSVSYRDPLCRHGNKEIKYTDAQSIEYFLELIQLHYDFFIQVRLFQPREYGALVPEVTEYVAGLKQELEKSDALIIEKIGARYSFHNETRASDRLSHYRKSLGLLLKNIDVTYDEELMGSIDKATRVNVMTELLKSVLALQAYVYNRRMEVKSNLATKNAASIISDQLTEENRDRKFAAMPRKQPSVQALSVFQASKTPSTPVMEMLSKLRSDISTTERRAFLKNIIENRCMNDLDLEEAQFLWLSLIAANMKQIKLASGFAQGYELWIATMHRVAPILLGLRFGVLKNTPGHADHIRQRLAEYIRVLQHEPEAPTRKELEEELTDALGKDRLATMTAAIQHVNRQAVSAEQDEARFVETMKITMELTQALIERMLEVESAEPARALAGGR